ncbi:MAG: phage tail assembly protein [Alphaproteobacteria bacterium]|nr:phage tail assembly protein [Alphaproteobacteria bacterium]MBO4700252.1 phage tail assembly protein [Alphaproteobacteria bacterium]
MEKIKLQYPVKIDEMTYTELTMRRSKVKDRLAVSVMKTTDEEKEINLFANLCEVSPQIIKELDETDYTKIQKVYMGFFGPAAISDEK